MLLNLERLTEYMAAVQLDAVLATAPENVTYLSGFWAMPQWIRRGPQTYVLWPAPKRAAPVIVADSSTLDLVADQEPWIAELSVYGDFHPGCHGTHLDDETSRRHAALLELPRHADAIAALAATMEGAGLAEARIGIDESGLCSHNLDEFRSRLPNVAWLPAAELLRNVRAVKTPEEISLLGQSARIAERSIEAALGEAREGATERDLARAFHVRTVLEDAMPVLGCIGFGERSALMNVQPSRRALRQGDVIRFDVGGRYRHYRADIARNAVLGAPSHELSCLHRALHRGVEHGCEMIRPGLTVAKLFQEIVETVRREGIANYRRHHVGHGIGLDGYDPPYLSPDSKETIEEGMVLCVETPYYEVGRWGLQVENMVVVRPHGAELLTVGYGELIEVPL